MELLNHSVHKQAIENVYTIQHATEGVLIYKEWIDSDNGKCIDYLLISKGGYTIDDEELIKEIQGFIDSLQNQITI
jgi:uncharacterized protein (UPF0179 family)